MSEEEQSRGVTGREGAPGREGVQGREGRRGKTGVGRRGEKGERGQTGATLPWRVRTAFLILFALSIGASAASVYQIIQLRHVVGDNRVLARQGQQAHDALCVLKGDLRRRIEVGEQFLEEHPNGIPGITAASIRTSLDNQRSTLNVLKVNPCPPD